MPADAPIKRGSESEFSRIPPRTIASQPKHVVGLHGIGAHSTSVDTSCRLMQNYGMNAETLREILKRTPFEQFQVRMSSGEVHDIRHPEFAMVTPGRLVVADPATERIAILSMFHITEVRMLQPAA